MIGKKKEGETHAVTLDQGSFTKRAGTQSPVNFQPPYVPYLYIATTSQALYTSPYPPMIEVWWYASDYFVIKGW